jgi:type I restriction enzyme S subunit
LRWLVRGPAWWEQVGKYINVGAVFDSLRCADILKFELPVPPISDQLAIAEVLWALDDKIDLNRRTNETLEELARALFRSWFVDFDPVRAKAEGRRPVGMDPETATLFPAELEETSAGVVPIGWQRTTLKETTSKIGSGATPRGGDRAYVASGVAFIRSQNVYDSNFIWDGLVRLTEEDAEQLRGVTVLREDVLLNITGASILRTCVVDPSVLPARVNQHVAIVRAKPDVPPRFLHLNLLLPGIKSYLLGFDAGASRQAVTKAHIESVPILMPSLEILSAFRNVTDPIFQSIENRQSESRTLAELRDTLLTKLMSGELRVRDAERAVGRVA